MAIRLNAWGSEIRDQRMEFQIRIVVIWRLADMTLIYIQYSYNGHCCYHLLCLRKIPPAPALHQATQPSDMALCQPKGVVNDSITVHITILSIAATTTPSLTIFFICTLLIALTCSFTASMLSFAFTLTIAFHLTLTCAVVCHHMELSSYLQICLNDLYSFRAHLTHLGPMKIFIHIQVEFKHSDWTPSI